MSFQGSVCLFPNLVMNYLVWWLLVVFFRGSHTTFYPYFSSRFKTFFFLTEVTCHILFVFWLAIRKHVCYLLIPLIPSVLVFWCVFCIINNYFMISSYPIMFHTELYYHILVNFYLSYMWIRFYNHSYLTLWWIIVGILLINFLVWFVPLVWMWKVIG